MISLDKLKFNFKTMGRNKYQEEKYSKFINSSKRRIQRRVLKLEKSIAKEIHDYIQLNYQNRWFENNFAFLSCWKFNKLGFGKSNIFWCDAIYFEDFHIENNRTLIFNGYAWIGLLSNIESQWKIPVTGKFRIDSNGKSLKNYILIFYNNNQKIILSKQ